MLHRILDPASSTRRTAEARNRLAEHPMTTALLDAGLRLLLADFAVSAPAPAPPVRLFDSLSAARTCAAATTAGPLRVTEGHLRDRWPLHGDFVADLLAYGLWELHWSGIVREVEQLAQAVRDPRRRPDPHDLAPMAAHLGEMHLYTGRDAVTHRLELLTATLAAARPELRAARVRSYQHLDAVYGGLYADLFGAIGLRPVPGADLDALVVALGAITEGANLRLMARSDDPVARAAAARTIAVAGGMLVSAHWAPGPGPSPSTAPTTTAPTATTAPMTARTTSAPVRLELADVLTRLTGPATGTRRTRESRRRLAADAITRQLLDGGIAVLAEEFGLVRGTRETRAFGALSVARVVAEARSGGGDGAGATAAQLRDRWSVQEHYVDDLVSYSLRQRLSLVDVLVAGARGGGGRPDWDLSPGGVPAALVDHLERVRSGPQARLRLLVATLADARPGMATSLVRLDDEQQAALMGFLQADLDRGGLQLRPGLHLQELAGWLLALHDGVEIRLLATGEQDVRATAALLAGSARALVSASTQPKA